MTDVMFTAGTAVLEIVMTTNTMKGSIVLCRKIDVEVVQNFLDVIDPMLRRGIEIDVYLDSHGGDLRASLLLARFLGKRARRLASYNLGSVDSAATLLFMAAGRRVARPDASFGIHSPLDLSAGEVNCGCGRVVEKLTDETCQFMQERIGLQKSLWRKMMAKGVSLSADQAMKLGVVTEMRCPVVPRKTIYV